MVIQPFGYYTYLTGERQDDGAASCLPIQVALPPNSDTLKRVRNLTRLSHLTSHLRFLRSNSWSTTPRATLRPCLDDFVGSTIFAPRSPQALPIFHHDVNLPLCCQLYQSLRSAARVPLSRRILSREHVTVVRLKPGGTCNT